MARTQSTGTCAECGQSMAKSAVTRHLRGCARSTQGTEQVFEIEVSHGRGSPHWLHLDALGDASLRDLDALLRQTWLECCGHLSEFKIDGQSFDDTPRDDWGYDDDQDDDEVEDMSVPLSQVLREGLTFKHVYDFGSTTELRLRVTGTRTGSVGRAGGGPAPGVAARKGRRRRTPTAVTVAVVARNDPPDAPCMKCKASAATTVCTQCVWDGKGLLCDACAPRHKCGEDYQLPLVNSPRTGVCGYSG
jgi:hypothetical protein